MRERRAAAARGVAHLIVGHHPGFIAFERYVGTSAFARELGRPRGEGGGAAREGRELFQGLVRCGRCGRRMQVGYCGRRCAAVLVRARPRVLRDRALSVSAAGGSSGWCSTPSSGRWLPPGSMRRSARSSTPSPLTRRGCARPSWSSSARSAPNARDGSSTPANPRTGSSRERSSVSGSSGAHVRHRRARIAASPPEPGAADRRGDLLVPACRRGPAQGVRRSHDHRPGSQAPAARDPYRDRRHSRPRTSSTRPAAGQMGGRPFTDHDALGPAAARATPSRTRSSSCAARRRVPRPADRGDPRPPGTATGAGNPFTAHRVLLRTHHKIPAATSERPRALARRSPSRKPPDELGVSTATVHRWLREGFSGGERVPRGAPWQILITAELRARVRQHAPDGWLALTEAAEALGVARQTVLHKVQRGDLARRLRPQRQAKRPTNPGETRPNWTL